MRLYAFKSRPPWPSLAVLPVSLVTGRRQQAAACVCARAACAAVAALGIYVARKSTGSFNTTRSPQMLTSLHQTTAWTHASMNPSVGRLML